MWTTRADAVGHVQVWSTSSYPPTEAYGQERLPVRATVVKDLALDGSEETPSRVFIFARHPQREHAMAKYMIRASYSPDGIKGVMAKGGSARADAIEKLAAGVGGTVESVYFSFGSDDLFAVVDAPSHEAMAAIAGTVAQTGAVSRYETVILLTPAQIDEAANMTIDYTPPGS